jgi:uncharacterized protein (TIGR03790 family)
MLLHWAAWGGGSGLNVVVVVNQNSTNSIQLGNYYLEQRSVPPQNLLRLAWPGGRVSWTKTEYTTYLLNPLLAMLSARQLTNQIDYVLLSMDIPYRITDTNGANATTSGLFYGFKPDGPGGSCSLPAASLNAYAGSEGIFRATPPTSPNSNSFLVTMITASNLPLARMIIDQGRLGDGTFPSQPAYLAKSDDRLRNIRYLLFDDAIFNTRLRGDYNLVKTNTNAVNLGYELGYQNGLGLYSAPPGVFAPGAMADTLTSFSGILFEPNDQTPMLVFLAAGAAGSFGPVIEPCAYFQKFASPQIFFYQSRGFTLAECYYMGVTNPYQGLLVGEPLSAPFASPPSGGWANLVAGARLAGTTNLGVAFASGATGLPVQQVDLFVDGLKSQTLTNIPPRQGNTVTVLVNGKAANYTVPAGATLKSVVTGVANAINGLPNAKMLASAHGDRVEMQSTDINLRATSIPLNAQTSQGSASLLTTFIVPSDPVFLDSTARGLRSYTITNIPQAGDYLQLRAVKTNGQIVTVAMTNQVASTNLADFARAFFAKVNAEPALQGPDGLAIEDINMHEDYPYNVYIYGVNDHSGEFNVVARSPGWQESQIQVTWTASRMSLSPSGTLRLDENLTDLRPRAHIYLAAGLPSLAFQFSLSTTQLADGVHELTAVAYEGTHVHTQKLSPWSVEIHNTTLNATLTLTSGASNTVLGLPLQFAVAAAGGAVTNIELFGQGGSLGSVSGQATAQFTVPSESLGVGLLPFYAVVSANGKQFRTAQQWVRVVAAGSPEPAFPIFLTAPPPLLSWTATAGRPYEVLKATNVANPFQPVAFVTPTNGSGSWVDTNAPSGSAFYRVRTSQ